MVLEHAELDAVRRPPALRADFAKLGLRTPWSSPAPTVDANFKLAARNIPNIDVLPNAGLNVYDVLRRDTLVLTKAAVEAIAARFAEPRRPRDGRDRPPLRHHPRRR